MLLPNKSVPERIGYSAYPALISCLFQCACNCPLHIHSPIPYLICTLKGIACFYAGQVAGSVFLPFSRQDEARVTR